MRGILFRMGWTNWRKLAERDRWFDDQLDHEGASCYELAIGGPRGGGITPQYTGETGNERQRIGSYGRGSDSNLEAMITGSPPSLVEGRTGRAAYGAA